MTISAQQSSEQESTGQTAAGNAGSGQAAVSPVEAAVHSIADQARTASRRVARANRGWKDRALLAIGEALMAKQDVILRANALDVEAGRENGTSKALLDRLRLDPDRIASLASALENLASLPDPVGSVVRGQTLPNGLRMRQVHVPMGVVAAIYEARPNVTVDIAGLAIKSGNAVILRGGSAAARTNETLVGIIRDELVRTSLPADAVQSVDEYGREGANALMKARGRVDVLIPRGGRNLIQTVVNNASVPVIETGEGNVHVFVDATADEEMAADIAVNAKTHRPSVCNAAETLLVHKDSPHLGTLLTRLSEAGVRLHVDRRVMAALPGGVTATEATDDDWASEYMDLEMAVAMVDDVDEAMEHIRTWSSGHTEAIVTNSLANSELFTAEVDSAAVMVNASTRFTDGAELGLGAEVGISTQKMHARGPMGLPELTTTKWIVNGNGHIKP